jgi:hypothetical protein
MAHDFWAWPRRALAAPSLTHHCSKALGQRGSVGWREGSGSSPRDEATQPSVEAFWVVGLGPCTMYCLAVDYRRSAARAHKMWRALYLPPRFMASCCTKNPRPRNALLLLQMLKAVGERLEAVLVVVVAVPTRLLDDEAL